MTLRGLWKWIRRIWITAGITFFVVFTTWSLLAYRADAEAKGALRPGGGVQVREGDGYWTLEPDAGSRATGLVFFSGALVDPRA